jgi:hypothetical protein
VPRTSGEEGVDESDDEDSFLVGAGVVSAALLVGLAVVAAAVAFLVGAAVVGAAVGFFVVVAVVGAAVGILVVVTGVVVAS